MKKKQNNWVVNKQEDEDGFSLHPYNVIICENTKVKENISSIRNTANSESVSVKFTMISSKVRRRISPLIYSVTAK